MEYFNIKYPYNNNPNKNTLFYIYLGSFLIRGISKFINKKYYIAAMFIIAIVILIIAKYITTMNSKKEQVTPFFGIVIDPEKESISNKEMNRNSKEIFFDDIQFIKLNPPYNDTLEINTKDRKVTRMPLYWLGEEDQKRIKEILKQYIS